jgi:hypothetical protein
VVPNSFHVFEWLYLSPSKLPFFLAFTRDYTVDGKIFDYAHFSTRLRFCQVECLAALEFKKYTELNIANPFGNGNQGYIELSMATRMSTYDSTDS